MHSSLFCCEDYVRIIIVRIPGEGLGNWEGAVLQCFDPKTPTGVILQGLLAQTFLGFYCFF